MFSIKSRKTKKIKPLEKGFYAFNYQRAGDFLIFVDELTDYYRFIYVPGGMEFFLTPEDFSASIVNETISFVEQLPQHIFDESLNLSLSQIKKTEYSSIHEK